jgi:DNA-binding CsgD family transcriptional regulator
LHGQNYPWEACGRVYGWPMKNAPMAAEELSDLIGLVYDSAFEEVQWKSLIDRIAARFPGLASAVHVHEGARFLPAYVTSRGGGFMSFSDSSVDTFAVPGMIRVQNGYVARSRKDYPGDWFETPMSAMLRLHGYGDIQYLKLDSLGARGAMLAFALPDDPEACARIHDPLFELLKLLSPHAVRAFQLARALTLARRATEVFSGFLDRIILPMLVTDAAGRFMFANAAGRRLLDRGTPFVVAREGRLACADPADTSDLHRRIREMAREMVPDGMRLETRGGALLCCITPFRPSMRDATPIDRHLLDEERLFAVFVGQSAADAINAALLEDVFDLTPREAEVCAALISGQSAADIAEASGRALKTVRNQVQVVYEKVGVTSNVALIEALSVFRTVGAMFDADGMRGERLIAGR